MVPKLVITIARNQISVDTGATAVISTQSLGHRTIERFQAWAKEAEPRLRDLADYELFGGHLYEFLFQGQIQRALDVASATAAATKQSLRLELRFDQDATELAGVPWEFLYFRAPTDGKRGYFMGTHSGFSLIRTDVSTLNCSSIQLESEPRILVVASCPDELPYVVWRPVAEDITTKLAGRVVATAEQSSPAPSVRVLLDLDDLTTLRAELESWRPHILQFIGHGMQDGTEGKLALLKGSSPWVTATQLINLFVNVPTSERPRLVLLHACDGGTTARASLSPKFGFGSTASMLLAEEIPAVVAMQYEIDQNSAISFTSHLYAEIFKGRAIHEAVQSGRSSLWSSAASVPAQAPARAVGAPVLYMSGTDGVLFAKGMQANNARNEIRRDDDQGSRQPEADSQSQVAIPIGPSGFGGGQ